MKKNYDLTQGDVLQKLLLVAVPIMGTQFMQMAYNLTDMYWLGRMQPDSMATMAVAASGIGGMFIWLSQALIMYGRMGAEIGVSQNLGRGDRSAAQHYAQNATTLSVILGVLYGLILAAFTEPLIALFAIPEPDMAQNTIAYLRIVGIGMPFTFLSAAITGVFNGAGNSRLSFVANFIGLIVNMALDPWMILNLNMGVPGAALATILAQCVVCLVFVILSLHRSSRIFEGFRLIVRLERAVTTQILKWSTPVALESGAFTLLAMTVTRLNASFGQGAVAVQRIGSQVESLSWLIGGGFATAVTAFVGQNYGANRPDRIREGSRISFLTMAVWGVFITAIMLLFGRQLFTLFSREQDVIDLGGQYLMLIAVCELPMCLESCCTGVFRGVGKTMPSSVCSIASNVLRVPLVYILVGSGMGVYGIFVGVAATSLLRSLSICVWYAVYARRQRAQIALSS